MRPENRPPASPIIESSKAPIKYVWATHAPKILTMGRSVFENFISIKAKGIITNKPTNKLTIK